ncbi:MAG TPA: peptidoglycan DD-metalloendopeptidase family protein [Candidatus Wallbacteria bacterium]|nr:peptidoglycan DD-metalloendopeptidase family protein [Candidatus Wallbacteria bacterium]
MRKLKIKQLNKTIIFVAYTIFFCAGFVSAQGLSTTEIQSKKADLSNIEARISENGKILGEIKADIERYKSEYDVKKAEYEKVKGQLDENQKRAAELYEQKLVLAKELKLSTDNLLRKKNLFSDRIKAIYKSSFSKKAGFVMESKTFADFYINLFYLSKIIQSDSEFISDISKKVATIKLQREELARKMKELERIDESSKSYEKSIRLASGQMNDYLAKLHQKQQFLTMQSGGLLSDKERIEREIGAIENNYVKNIEKTEAPSLKSGVENAPAAKDQAKMDLTKLAFSWPLKSSKTVLSFYGTQKDPKYNINYFNPGIDISGQQDEPVLAAVAGKVKYKGEMKSIGKLLIIDHGGGITTLYSHLGGIEVGMGQEVVSGESIGSIAKSKGESAQPYLHFEIRVNGNAKDPMDYL